MESALEGLKVENLKENAPHSEFEGLKYMNGFGNSFSSECREGAVTYGLFAEQLSGSAFTVKRAQNQRTWYYKLRPSVLQGQYSPAQRPFRILADFNHGPKLRPTPNQLRWAAIPAPKEGDTFLTGLTTIMGAGEPSLKQGVAVYVYSASESMGKTAMVSSDGDFLIVPQTGTLMVKTLNGLLRVAPKEVLVVPRGILFTVEIQEEAKGWACEVFNGHFVLPELGVIGTNGLANPAHFQFPSAWHEAKQEPWRIFNKFLGEMYEAKTAWSPYDVVGWKGNYSPYKYNLSLYNAIGSISYDHPDPSIFTVLTCKSAIEGVAALDFVIFPPRWLVMEHTFKPPYYHRNCMTQFMGNICGQYDAKPNGFAPGASSLHSAMTPHGPDAESYRNALVSPDLPLRVPDTNLAFMFESGYILKTTVYAFEYLHLDQQYADCWQPLAQLHI